MGKNQTDNKSLDLSCDQLLTKVLTCYKELDSSYFRRTRKMKECEEFSQALQFCWVDYNKGLINSNKRTSVIGQNQLEVEKNRIERKMEDKLQQINYLHTKDSSVIGEKTPTKFTVEL